MRVLAIATAALLALAACGEPEDETNNGANNGASNNGASNNGASNNGASNNGASNNGASNNGGAVSFADDVVPILVTNCAVNGCHGGAGQGAFAIAAGMDATAADLQAALDGVSAMGGGLALIEPSDPQNSEIYLRTSASGPRATMPLGGMLDSADVDTLEAWITAGADYGS